MSDSWRARKENGEPRTMRTEYRMEGDEVWFIVRDMPQRYRQAARHLYFEPRDDGAKRRFPAASRHLKRAYENFSRHVEDLLSQQAGEKAVPWDDALEAFLCAIKGEDLNWYLVGSTALAVRGLAVAPGDIDLIVDNEGASLLADLLLDALIEPSRPVTGWVGDWFGRAFLGATVEWVGGVNPAVDDPFPTDFGPAAAARLETICWRGHTLCVPPLDLLLAVSERRGLTERAGLIREAMMHPLG
jgi:hypothetical protein